MSLRLLADLVLLLHLAFILFAVFGALGALIWRRAPLVHLPVLAWGTYVEFSGGICPLTPFENALRRAAGQAGFSGSFVDHYLSPLVYPPALGTGAQLALGIALLAVNAALYGVVLWRGHSGGGGAAPHSQA
jgi:hypothetical protein